MLEVVPGLANNLCWCETKEVCNTGGKKNTKSSAGEIIGQGMRAKKKGCNFQGLCQANCQSVTQSYPRL